MSNIVTLQPLLQFQYIFPPQSILMITAQMRNKVRAQGPILGHGFPLGLLLLHPTSMCPRSSGSRGIEVLVSEL